MRKKYILNKNTYSSQFVGPNFRRKHASKQVNGETMISQNTLILHNGMRKSL